MFPIVPPHPFREASELSVQAIEGAQTKPYPVGKLSNHHFNSATAVVDRHMVVLKQPFDTFKASILSFSMPRVLVEIQKKTNLVYR
jgi:hypothetical protein